MGSKFKTLKMQIEMAVSEKRRFLYGNFPTLNKIPDDKMTKSVKFTVLSFTLTHIWKYLKVSLALKCKTEKSLRFFFFFPLLSMYSINMLQGLNNEANFKLPLFSWRNPKGGKLWSLRL